MRITKQDFLDYESVRESGVTNMFLTRVVQELSGLSREKQSEIRKNYTSLSKKYLKV